MVAPPFSTWSSGQPVPPCLRSSPLFTSCPPYRRSLLHSPCALVKKSTDFRVFTILLPLSSSVLMFYVQFFAIRRGEHGAGVVVNRAHDGVCRASAFSFLVVFIFDAASARFSFPEFYCCLYRVDDCASGFNCFFFWFNSYVGNSCGFLYDNILY
jgi:hypothetical protein